jgi:hypothetical protein
LGLTVIHEYQGGGAILSRKCHTQKDCCHSWSELCTDNGKIGHGVARTSARLFCHPARAFLGVPKTLCVFLLCSKAASLPGGIPSLKLVIRALSRDSGTSYFNAKTFKHATPRIPRFNPSCPVRACFVVLNRY